MFLRIWDQTGLVVAPALAVGQSWFAGPVSSESTVSVSMSSVSFFIVFTGWVGVCQQHVRLSRVQTASRLDGGQSGLVAAVALAAGQSWFVGAVSTDSTASVSTSSVSFFIVHSP